jgi:hypothetical protein
MTARFKSVWQRVGGLASSGLGAMRNLFGGRFPKIEVTDFSRVDYFIANSSDLLWM